METETGWKMRWRRARRQGQRQADPKRTGQEEETETDRNGGEQSGCNDAGKQEGTCQRQEGLRKNQRELKPGVQNRKRKPKMKRSP